MSNNQQLSWDINPDNAGMIDVFPLGKPSEVIMKISLAEANQAARNKVPGLVVDAPVFKPKKLLNKMATHPNSVLSLTRAEALAFAAWVKKHVKNCPIEYSDFDFLISHSSGIGKSTYVHCSCGDKCDITDVSVW